MSQVYTETFDGNNLPDGWLDYSEAGFDFVNPYDGSVSLFKQSDGDEIIILASPSFDLSLYTALEIDFYGYNLAFGSESVPSFHVGILETEDDFSSFRSIYELQVDNPDAEVLRIELAAYQQMGNIAFKLVGEKSHIIYVDNFKLYEESLEANYPIAVSDVSIEPMTDGTNDVSFTWMNPAFEADGDDLAQLRYISLRSFGTEIIRFDDPEIGEQQTFVGTVPVGGYYNFDIVPVNDAGDGHQISTGNFWAGLDVPAAVRNLEISLDGEETTLSWEAPIEGSNGAFFDGVIESYIIRRSDGREFTVPGNMPEFVDVLDTEGSINYTIRPTNISGWGDITATDPIFYVTDEYIYYEDFNFDIVSAVGESSNYSHQWTSRTNTSNTTWEWFSSNFIGENAGELSWIWSGVGDSDDMVSAISPVMNTEGFASISLSYNYYLENADYSLLIQTSSDGGNTWNDVDEIEVDGLLQGSYLKTIANSDVGSDNFQIAFTRLGPANQNPFMRIDNIRVKFQPGVDLRVIDIDAPEEIEPGQEVEFLGSFENNSSTIVSSTVTFEILERFTGNTSPVESWVLDIDDMTIGEVSEYAFGYWTAVEGEYILRLSIEGVDDNLLDNNVISKNINVFNLRERDLIVIEEFSGTWCAFCPGAALGVEDLYLEGYNVAAITYHRGDAYETDIVDDKMNQYNILGFPSVVFDGVTKVEGGDVSVSIVDQYRPVVEENQQKRSPLHIEFLNAELDDQPGGEYYLRGRVSSESPILNPNLELILAVTESHIEEEWQDLPFLDYLQREYYSEVINLENQAYTFELSIPISDAVNLDNSDVIVFVQDPETNQIYNGNARKLNDNFLGANVEDQSILEAKIYPNPVEDRLYIEMVESDLKVDEYIVRNIHGLVVSQGRVESQAFDVNSSGFGSGMYTLELISGKETIKRKFIKL